MPDIDKVRLGVRFVAAVAIVATIFLLACI